MARDPRPAGCALKAARDAPGAPLHRRAFFALLATALTAGLASRWLQPIDTAKTRWQPAAAERPSPVDGSESAPASLAADELGDVVIPEPNGRPSPVVPLVVVCRDALGLVPARDDKRRHVIERLTLHHTAVALDASREAPSRLRGHQRFHQQQGWPDIAYHYGIDQAGNVYELRDPSVPGDTFTDYDPTGHFLVVCEGDFNQQQPTDAMLDAAAGLFTWATSHYGLARSTLGAHRDYTATACPGDALYARIGEIEAAADRLRGAAQLRLDRRCGPEGDAMLAAIETGVTF